MDPVAILMFILIAGIVWGGFGLIATTAIRKERNKRDSV